MRAQRGLAEGQMELAVAGLTWGSPTAMAGATRVAWDPASRQERVLRKVGRRHQHTSDRTSQPLKGGPPPG